MSTEYRRGIPSTAHVEAATRLGLLWRGSDEWLHRFRNQNGRIEVCYFQDPNATPYWEVPDFGIEDLDFRPIRPDGTPVDWEVLDQEVARAGLQGQPQGFRADLWRRICEHFQLFWTRSLSEVIAIDVGGDIILSGSQPWSWSDAPGSEQSRSDILTCWTVYQELKPLYDLVDGAQGEAAMPGDVVTEWARQARGGENIRPDWELVRTPEGLLGRTTDRQGGIVSWSDSENWLGQPLRNFTAILDAVAKRRVAEWMQRQTQAQSAPIVTSAQTELVLDEAALRSLILNLPNVAAITNRIERGSRQRDRYIVCVRLADPDVPLDRALAAQIPRNVHVHCNGHGAGGQRGVGGAASSIFSPTGNRGDAVAPPIQEPRRVNVEPRRFADVRPDRHGWRWWLTFPANANDGLSGRADFNRRIEIEAGNYRWLDESARHRDFGNLRAWNDRTVIPTDEQGNPVSWESIVPAGTVQSGRHRNDPVAVDTLDAATENEVQRITQVVASITQQALQQTLGSPVTVSPTTGHVEPPTTTPTPSRFALIEIDDADPTAERIRLEQESERQRLAELRRRLASERAAQPAEDVPTTTSRFDLIEPDPQADPTASIRAWEARQAAAKVRPTAAPARPAAAPRRPAIEVVDAEVDGLSRVDVVTTLVGRAFNGRC